MVKTGTLRINGNTSVLNAGPGDRKRLAKEEGEGEPLGNATDFLVSERSLDDQDFIFVTGDEGPLDGVTVIFITDAGLATDATEVLSARTSKKSATTKKKPAKKGNKKAGKKGTRKTSKKGRGKKSTK